MLRNAARRRGGDEEPEPAWVESGAHQQPSEARGDCSLE
jgi:hypothetical protein